MHNAKEAISTYLPQWIYRPHGNMNHRLTQLMTGHGCFRRFLYRIRKADSRTCLQCLILGNAIFEDTAEHTLFECIAWNDERRDMMAVLKDPHGLMSSMKFVSLKRTGRHYAQKVIQKKEDSEKAREREREIETGT